MGPVAQFFEDIRAVYKTGEASEHSYRPALKTLFDALSPDDVEVVNEPKRRTDVGAPDFAFFRDGVARGHCEAKDIGLGITTLKGYSVEQKQRYTKAFSNLLYTNGLEFEFIFESERRALVNLGDVLMGDLQPHADAFDQLEHLLRDFFLETPRSIHSSKRLAELMAGKAAMIKDVMCRALVADLDDKAASPLVEQYGAFKDHLIHDIQAADFADLYAETIAYGLFAARLHDESLDTFSRMEALELLPKSNPFLRSLFSYIAGPDLDDRISWIIDDLAKIFLACDLTLIMADFGKLTGQNDPFLHFYETFLAAYNPAKRKARGVWYTPEPVVNFIVRAVDEVLKTEFGLADGLANTSKVKIEIETGQKARTAKGDFYKDGRMATETQEVHRVQILDPATGTGTFLAEVIKQIAPRIKGVAPGMWSQYIEQDLIPRLHGFELLMASYAMCHMKLDMILTELGYKPTSKSPPRLSVYLTNSLEEGEPADQTLPFAQWLSREAKGANTIKRDKPIMCVIGNPPYNPSSTNNNPWIREAIAVYKHGLDERKINLDDDYIKFIRLAELFIERNHSGVIGYITNNSYLDGNSHRILRQRIVENFDRVLIVNLHGDIRNESVEGKDENVFDITQGVAILIATRSPDSNNKNIREINYISIEGTRKEKYAILLSDNIKELIEPLKPAAPDFILLPRAQAHHRYVCLPSLTDWYGIYSSGIQTKRDKVCIGFDISTILSNVKFFRENSPDFIRSHFNLPKDGRDWKIDLAKKDIISNPGEIIEILYKPFDKRFTYFTGKTKGFIGYPRKEVMKNVVGNSNLCLISNRQTVRSYFSFSGVSSIPINHGTFYLGNRGQDYCFPLYLYPAEDELDRGGSVCLNNIRGVYKWIAALIMLRPGLVAAR